MGSKASKAKRPTPVATKAVTIPRIPQEIIDEILDHLATHSDLRSLRACALVSRSWVQSCRRHIFHTILFAPKSKARWLETFPVPEESPAHLVRDLRFTIGGDNNSAPERFSDYTRRFTNVERITFLAHGCLHPLWTPSFGRLPQSVTSLTIDTDAFDLFQIRDVMVQLPNLNDLSLSGFPVMVAGCALQGIGAVLRGRFGGQLRLFRGHVSVGIADVLLGIPTGLHFTEIQIYSTHECLLSVVRLVEACSKTLVKLSYTISLHCKSHPFFLQLVQY